MSRIILSCLTLLRIHRNHLPTIQGYAVMSIPVGGHQWIGVRVWAPYGLTRVYSEADFTHLVPEYVEANNWDSVP